jgi:hypothetical protein
MDIIAAMLAYLTCATGIIGALAISAFIVFATPDRTEVPQHVLVPQHALALTAKANATKPTAAVAAKPARVAARVIEHQTPMRSSVVAQSGIAKAARQKAQSARAQLRQMLQEERAKRWAYQQDPGFEARFLGYVD